MLNNLLIIFFVFLIFIIVERIYPLRLKRENFRRVFINFSLTALALPITRILAFPLVLFAAYAVEAKNWGLLNILKLNKTENHLPGIILGFMILDYSQYWWHVGNHQIKTLWRFHQVHHTDRDMDVTTAFRFHFGELFLSSLLRCLLILFTGIQIETILFYDLLVTSLTIFHHSNFKLPFGIDKILSFIIVTPLYHQNHHSYFLEETNSNYATIFSFWDRFHHSYTKENSPKQITIGHPGFTAAECEFIPLIKMPFQQIRQWPMQWRKRN